MILSRSGEAVGRWPGLPFGRREVLVPEGASGDLQGPREHGRLHVAARWPGDDRALPPGVARYRPTTVAELCDRVPEDATVGVGPTGVPVSCTPESLAALPRAVDLRHRPRDVRVTRLGADSSFAAVARHQGSPVAYRVVDPAAPAVLLLAVRSGETLHERSRRDFADDCQQARIADPAELWERDDLPRWLRKLLETADEETP